MCGDCCRGLNEGEVYLYLEDIIKLANHLNLTGKVGLRKFARKYLTITKNTFYWRESGAPRGKNYKVDTLGFRFVGDDEHCQFLENNRCTVHEARPFQCRSFPFWQMMVSSRKNFVDYSKKCAGLRNSLGNEGKFYSRGEILEWAQKEHKIEKEHFLKMKEVDFDIYKIYPFLPPKKPQNKD